MREVSTGYYDSGEKAYEHHHMDCEPYGKWTWWYKSGGVKSIKWYDMGWLNPTTEPNFKAKYPEFYKEHYETGKE